MRTSITAVRRAGVALLLAVLCVLLLASPGSAHAELVGTSPQNGKRLATAPKEVTLTFSESVNLLDDGIRLLDDGALVPTPDPTADGHTVTWAMPAHLGRGAYLVTWRVISADGHPVEGAFSFGVGARPEIVPDDIAKAEKGAQTAPWQVVGARLLGYLAFAVVAGVVAVVLWCAPGRVTDPRLQRMTRWALGIGLGAAVLSTLLQGPYTAGVSLTHLFDPDYLAATLRTPFGTAMAWRLAFLLTLTALIWRLPGLQARPVRWLVPAVVIGTAGAIAASGHGIASGHPLDLVVVTLHVLTAGIWVGGLVVLVVLGRSVDQPTIRRFAALALTAVVVLVLTGVLNSLRDLQSVDQLFLTRYGALLLAKLGLVAATLAAATISRTRVRHDALPRGSVRLEAGLVVAVLTITAFLSMTSPPPQIAAPAAAATSAASASRNALATMTLGRAGSAGMGVIPATTAGSRLHLLLTGPDGQPLAAKAVELEVSNPARDVAGIPVPMKERNGVWVARFSFPFAGVWKAVITVHDQSPTAIVTAGHFTITS